MCVFKILQDKSEKKTVPSFTYGKNMKHQDINYYQTFYILLQKVIPKHMLV